MQNDGTIGEPPPADSEGYSQTLISEKVTEIADESLPLDGSPSAESSNHQAVIPEKHDRRKKLMKDRTVYAAYFKSIGAANTVVFLAFGVSFGFALEFPGELSNSNRGSADF